MRTPRFEACSAGSLHNRPRRADRRRLGFGGRLVWVLLLCMAVALSNCATTQAKRAEQLGLLGKTYADAVALAGEEAMESSISFSLAEIRKEHTGGAFITPEGRSKALEDQIAILKQRQQMVQKSNQLLALLAEYFTGLDQFAKQEVSTSFETASSGLIESINGISKAVENDSKAKAKISDAERTSLAKLSGLVARQVHGQALARVLERDAAMIGTQLKLMSKILATYSEWIRARSDMDLNDFYKDRVRKPFLGSDKLPGSWDQDVRRYLQGTSLSEKLAKAKAAGERMERFWAGYLAGETSVSEAIADLKDIEELRQEFYAYNKAWEDAQAAKPD